MASIADRALGCFLGALCGDALGAAVEGWSAAQVREAFPDGLTELQETRMGRGCYTDDGQMLLALAASLVNQRGRCVASDAATQFARAFDPQRGYGAGAARVLAQLQAQLAVGPLPPMLPSSKLQPQGGSYGNGGAMRIAPVGIVCRHAPVPVLAAAVRAALLPTHHVHPWAVEGALCQALAVAELCRLQPAAAGAGAQHMPPPAALQLLARLAQHMSGSEVMGQRLAAMQQALSQLYAAHGGPRQAGQGWREHFATPAWQFELATAAAVAPGEPDGLGLPSGFQLKATDAAAAALWSCVAHWRAPQDAVVAAVHFGGDTDTIACMTGALVGALHGSAWLPPGWTGGLERAADADWSCFNTPAVERLLMQQEPESGSGLSTPAGPQDPETEVLVRTTRNMGCDGAVRLARLAARLDVRQA